MLTDGYRSGKQQCQFVVEVEYPGKKAFFAQSITMVIERQPTEHETEALAWKEANKCVVDMWKECFPDGLTPPTIKKVTLGSIMFVPDDFTWPVDTN